MLQQNMRFWRSINRLSFLLGDERSHVPLPSSTLICRTVQHRLARTYDMWGPWFLGGTVLNTGCHGGAHCYVGLILQLAMEITAQVDITPGSPGLHPVRGTRASGPKELRQTSWRNEMRSLMVNHGQPIFHPRMKKFFSSETRWGLHMFAWFTFKIFK